MINIHAVIAMAAASDTSLTFDCLSGRTYTSKPTENSLMFVEGERLLHQAQFFHETKHLMFKEPAGSEEPEDSREIPAREMPARQRKRHANQRSG